MIRVVHSGSASRNRILTFYPSWIPDPGVKKAPDPGSSVSKRHQIPDPEPQHFFTICPSREACRWCPFKDCVYMWMARASLLLAYKKQTLPLIGPSKDDTDQLMHIVRDQLRLCSHAYATIGINNTGTIFQFNAGTLARVR